MPNATETGKQQENDKDGFQIKPGMTWTGVLRSIGNKQRCDASPGSRKPITLRYCHSRLDLESILYFSRNTCPGMSEKAALSPNGHITSAFHTQLQIKTAGGAFPAGRDWVFRLHLRDYSFWIFTAQALYSAVWLTGSYAVLVSQLALPSLKWKAIQTMPGRTCSRDPGLAPGPSPRLDD